MPLQNGVCFRNLNLLFALISLSSNGTPAASLLFINLVKVCSTVANDPGRKSSQALTQAGLVLIFVLWLMLTHESITISLLKLYFGFLIS